MHGINWKTTRPISMKPLLKIWKFHPYEHRQCLIKIRLGVSCSHTRWAMSRDIIFVFKNFQNVIFVTPIYLIWYNTIFTKKYGLVFGLFSYDTFTIRTLLKPCFQINLLSKYFYHFLRYLKKLIKYAHTHTNEVLWKIYKPGFSTSNQSSEIIIRGGGVVW